MGTLYYGDNLDILRRYLRDESVDLVYLDPPFNSAQNYNAFFQEKDGTAAASQIHAFEDTWHWDIETKKAYDAITERPGKVSDVMQAFHTFLGGNDMMAYLTMMSSRLVELRRVLKPTGSLYLHCDPTASHYLKLLLDAIFGAMNFRSEIIWKRTSAHSNVYRAFGDITDTIFFVSKTDKFLWNQIYHPLGPNVLEERFPNVDANGRRFRSENLPNPGIRPNLHYPYTASNGVTYQPHPNGWTCNLERMRELDKQGRLHFPAKTSVKDVRDLRGVLDREKAAIGILISLQPPTSPMETEAASGGFYEHKTNKQKFPRLQLRTVKELMEGKGIERVRRAWTTPTRKLRSPKRSTVTSQNSSCSQRFPNPSDGNKSKQNER